MWPAASPPTRREVAQQFGIDVDELAVHAGGFEADSYTDGRWFVKLFRFEPDSDAVLALTGELAARGMPVPPAMRALDGGYTGEHDGRRYAVFPVVQGRVGTWDDMDGIARHMRDLHGLTAAPNDDRRVEHRGAA